MKYLYLLVLLLLLTVENSSQSLSNSPELSVIDKKWRMTWRSNSTASSPELNKDPFSGNNQVAQANQAQKEYLEHRAIKQAEGRESDSPSDGKKKPEIDDGRGESTLFTYQIKVKNNGTKTIKKVIWDYVFFDSTTKQEVGRHEFRGEADLKPGETDNLVKKLYTPPA